VGSGCFDLGAFDWVEDGAGALAQRRRSAE
jgi:hypothetical protein